MDISLDSIVTVADDVVSCDLEDEAAILNLKDGIYYGLDPVGASIWKLLQKPVKVGEILETLLQEYEVGEEECRSDLIELLEELKDKELVKINN